MADSIKVWRQNKWFGGYSDDAHFGIDGSFYKGSGVEIRRFPRILQIAKRYADQADGDLTGTWQCYTTTSTYGDTFVAGQGGKIYRRASGGTAWALVYTDSGGDTILDITEFNGYLYWTTKDRLHRIVVSDTATDTTWSTVTEDYKTLTNTSNTSHPLLSAYNNLYIGDVSQIAMLSTAGTLTANKVQLEKFDHCDRITFNGNYLRFWCHKGGINGGGSTVYSDNGSVYFWNGTSSAYNERVKLAGIFHSCTSMDGLDYFLAGYVPALYVMNGLNPVKLKTLPAIGGTGGTDLALSAAYSKPYTMVNTRGTIYFATPQDTSDNYDSGVWSYGRLNESYPYSLTLEYATTYKPAALGVSDSGLMIEGAYSSNYYLYTEDWTKSQDTGYVETRIFDGGGAWTKKDSLKVCLGFYPLTSTGQKIEVYANTDFGGYGSAILTVDYAVTADRSRTTKCLTLPFTGKEFSHIQFKIKLTAGTTSKLTPKVYDFALYYEDIKQP
jgi:hypothetical protein